MNLNFALALAFVLVALLTPAESERAFAFDRRAISDITPTLGIFTSEKPTPSAAPLSSSPPSASTSHSTPSPTSPPTSLPTSPPTLSTPPPSSSIVKPTSSSTPSKSSAVSSAVSSPSPISASSTYSYSGYKSSATFSNTLTFTSLSPSLQPSQAVSGSSSSSGLLVIGVSVIGGVAFLAIVGFAWRKFYRHRREVDEEVMGARGYSWGPNTAPDPFKSTLDQYHRSN